MWLPLGLLLILSEAWAFNVSLGAFGDVVPLRYPHRKSQIRRQRAIPDSTPFFCQDSVPWGRSKERPTSVHRLRPGDIDVVAAIGDSLVAGSGALEEYALGAIVEYRGVSWCAGGDGSWREFLTLPNILKEYNPALRGYSTGTGEWLTKNAGLNVAFPVASDQDAYKQAKDKRDEIAAAGERVIIALYGGNPNTHNLAELRYQQFARAAMKTSFNLARLPPTRDSALFHSLRTYHQILVARMRSTPNIDIARDWKMITVFVGANDLCSASCLSPVAWSPAAHARKLAKALDYFHMHLPRTIVNLVPVLDVSVSVRVRRPLMCRVMHSLFCACFHRGGGELAALVRTARRYQATEAMLVDSGRYDTTEDFAVVIQPFMKLFNAPQPPTPPLPLVIHQSYITHDCFHFSQKGHALAANLLWNNLLEPVGNKSENVPPVLLRSFKCPTREAPFIFTARNSKSYLLNGFQDGAEL